MIRETYIAPNLTAPEQCNSLIKNDAPLSKHILDAPARKRIATVAAHRQPDDLPRKLVPL